MQAAASPTPYCINASSLIWFWRKLSMQLCTVIEFLTITQLGSSLWFSFPSYVSSSSAISSSWFFSLPDISRSLILFPNAVILSANVHSFFLVVNSAFPSFMISSMSCTVTVSASATQFLATAISLSS